MTRSPVTARPERVAARTATFTESVIRAMTRLANAHGAINLAQGFPDFPMPAAMKEAACAAIDHDINQYAITWGARSLREAIAGKYHRRYGNSMSTPSARSPSPAAPPRPRLPPSWHCSTPATKS